MGYPRQFYGTCTFILFLSIRRMHSTEFFAVGGNRKTRYKHTRLRRRPCLLATYAQTWDWTQAYGPEVASQLERDTLDMKLNEMGFNVLLFCTY